jgi:predicted phosphodiesterase
MALQIAHLSDIHFKDETTQIGHDANEHMREDIILDLIKITKEYGKLDAIIVSGDVAFSGKETEFKSARNWLHEILDRTNSKDAEIIVCPGNHDVDRDEFKNDESIFEAQNAIRALKTHDAIQHKLNARLQTEAGKSLLMRSLQNYNNFALEFGCEFEVSREKYAWHRDLNLNDGSVLRVRGLNSTMFCGMKDVKRQLFLGRNAWAIKKQPGVEYLAFAHHPPSWLIDETEMGSELDDKAAIQMYGHEHTAKIAPGIRSVKMFAGAVNPERDHSEWVPGYNFVQVQVNNESGKRKLCVQVHSRQWQSTPPSQFTLYRGQEPDGTHKYEFELPEWNPSAKPIHKKVSEVEPELKAAMDDTTPEPRHKMTNHEFLRLFFNLSFPEKKKIFDELNLSDPKEDSLPQYLQVKNSLTRAKERGQIEAIVNKINRE